MEISNRALAVKRVIHLKAKVEFERLTKNHVSKKSFSDQNHSLCFFLE